MSFRILDQAPQYLLADGGVNSGGFLAFFENDTTTPKNTWSDKAMTVLNANPVQLDGSGRTNTDIWGDGTYTVTMLTPLMVEVWTRDDVEWAVTSGSMFPPGNPGQFLTTDGTNPSWADIRQLPDPTGSNGQVLITNGSGYGFQNLPAPPAPVTLDVAVTANSIRVGDGTSTTKWMQQRGTSTAGASGTPSTSIGITFPTPFSTVPFVSISLTSHSQPGGPVVSELTTVSTTGFTVLFDVAEGNSLNANIINPVPFSWMANGNVVFP